ncbi:MAG: capsular biosynthesis protein [Candidatus Omnitrophica bacterium CG07_land_8_20_14_0_80_42_15]|uniref:non-specific protein-tyrosine kinase n=1 Tax=Candidatus Aquitaenariimonas noxiae TaxID=1974741 RepID=A0A2J0KWQ2_9BACT|nr:MAG: capsular biosynthesis protein [Candidatus Omnitrophica bacterium CG07_land_8_20_14_0_80_42_15]
MSNLEEYIPYFDKKVIVLFDPLSPEAESYRSLRTNILRYNLDRPPKVLLLTSAHPEEGKSITSVNLAIVMAEIGKKTLLVDCDLRRPSVHGILGMDKTPGLSEVLYGTEEWDRVLKSCGIENLYIITSGTIPQNPSEIIGSDKARAFLEEVKNVFDVIILDAPCILAVTDGLILSSLADGVLNVIMAEKTPREAVMRTISMLKDVKGKILGIVFNKVNLRRSHYYYYYYYGARKKK